MKSNLKILFLPLLALAISSCSPSPYAGDEGQNIKLVRDTNENYVFDETATNVNGSMSYELFVRSFYDADGNGTGDFLGVKEKIPYLASLGIKTVWLMPICPSPTYHGYDIRNYFAVNSEFGTLADFDSMITTANEYHIDIMIDMVLNHCSKLNPYFRESYDDFINNNTDPDSKKDWFNWSYTTGDYKYGDLYYEARFDASMPDFNLDSEGVRNEIEDICKFWIEDHGVKGFRLDAVLYYYYNNTTKNVEFLSWLDSVCKSYNPDFYMVGECWSSDATVNSYHKSTVESFFRFGNASGGDGSIINMSKGYGDAKNFLKTIENNERKIKSNNPKGYSSYFLSNHDQDRISKNYVEELQNKVGASIYCLLPGTPFMYYGEEIQLVGKRNTSPDDMSDVRRRLPMVWSKNDKTGECKFPEASRKDLDTTVQVELGVEDKLNTNYSLLNHYKKVINVRNKYSFIKNGVFKSMYRELGISDNSLLAYKITSSTNSDDYIIIVHNLTGQNLEVPALGSEILDTINTSQRIPELTETSLKIGRYSTVILK